MKTELDYLKDFQAIETTEVDMFGETIQLINDKDVDTIKELVKEVDAIEDIESSVHQMDGVYSAEMYLENCVVYVNYNDMSMAGGKKFYSMSIDRND